MPTVIRKWNSLSEFVDYCSGDTEVPEYRRLSQRKGKGFHACESYDAASQIAFNWREGVERIEQIQARIALKAQRVRKQVVSREAGPGVVAMGKFVAGHPQPYMTLVDDHRAAKGKGKIVKVVFNCTASGGIDKEILETRGAAVLALVRALETMGRRVEVVVGMGGTGNRNWTQDYSVRVKGAHQKLNMNSVAFAMANPDMLRRFMFAAMEREPQNFRKAFNVEEGRYGMPGDLFDAKAGADVYIPEAMYGQPQWETEERAAVWVRETLEAQGIALK